MSKLNLGELISKNVDIILLVLFFSIFFLIGAGGALDHSLSNPFPKGMVAADIFHYYNYIEGYKQSGKFEYFPSYISYGRSDVIAYQPPIYYVGTTILSKLFGIQIYDAMHLIIFLSLAFAIIIVFYTIKRTFNRDVAVLSLPIMLLILRLNFYVAISWGRTPTVLADCMMLVLVWVVLAKEDLISNSITRGILVGMLLSALTLTHTPQLMFGGIFVLIYFGINKIIERKLTKTDILFYTTIVMVFLVLSSYYLIIFKTTVASQQPIFSSMSATDTSAYRWPLFSNFGVYSYILVLGMIAIFIFKDKMAMIFPFLMLIFGFSNLILGKRSLELRFMWPYFLCLFFGIAIYSILHFVKIKDKTWFSVAITFIVTIIICNTYVSSAGLSGSLANQYSWDVVNFLQTTDKDSKVLFLFNDEFYQTSYAMASERFSFMIPIEESVKAIQSNNLSKNIVTDMAGEGQSGAAYRKDGKVHFYLEEFNHSDIRNICMFDYYVVPKYARIPEIGNYNMKIANYLLSSENATVAHDNQYYAVLKGIKNPDCLPNKGVTIA